MDEDLIKAFEYLTPKYQTIAATVIIALFDHTKEHELVIRELMKRLEKEL